MTSISTFDVARQAAHLHGGARRRRIDDVLRVDGVHAGEVVHVGEEHRGAHDVVEIGAGGLEERRDVAHHLLGLLGDVAREQGAVFGSIGIWPDTNSRLPARMAGE